MTLFVAIFLPLFFMPVAWVAGSRLGKFTGFLVLPIPVISAALLISNGLHLPGRAFIELPWIPSLGLNLLFLLDGLSLFYGLVVSLMGVLVVFYACFYLDDHYKHHNRFYSYLLLFIFAMLGTVFSGNLLLLFVFWEITGIASFLLIGFSHSKSESRLGARMALMVTATTGLVFLAGVIVTYIAVGTYNFQELLFSPESLEGLSENSTLLTAGFLFVIIGAFGKSAQFPFHFWLPGAMAAPTPVSAYLHSATMVKLGVFLTGRMFPVFSDIDLWAVVLPAVGLFTAVLAGYLAIVSTDLKSILAYSTVLQLGLLIGFYGLAGPEGVTFDTFHVMNHVFYKGALFMIAGIVDHATGSRDIRKLGGLLSRMPLTALAALIALASMAGIPGTTGFISKEFMLADAFAFSAVYEYGWLAIAAIAVASIAKVAFSIRLFAHVFLRKMQDEVKAHYHAPSLFMQLPPLFLAMGALVFGIFTSLGTDMASWLAVPGMHPSDQGYISLWHGFTPELYVSIAVFAGGGILYGLLSLASWRWVTIPAALRFGDGFNAGIEQTLKFAKKLTVAVRSNQPLDNFQIIIGFTIFLVGGATFLSIMDSAFLQRMLTLSWVGHIYWLKVLVGALIISSVMGIILTKRWPVQIIFLSAAGFLITFYFVLYRAPDLTLTQLLIETVTLILALLLLVRFPETVQTGEARDERFSIRTVLNIIIASGMGIMITTLILWFMESPHPDPIGPYVLTRTVPLAEGTNAVNTILVDFRGIDTMGEILVLLIATLGILGIMMRYKRTEGEWAEKEMRHPGLVVPKEIPENRRGKDA